MKHYVSWWKLIMTHDACHRWNTQNWKEKIDFVVNFELWRSFVRLIDCCFVFRRDDNFIWMKFNSFQNCVLRMLKILNEFSRFFIFIIIFSFNQIFLLEFNYPFILNSLNFSFLHVVINNKIKVVLRLYSFHTF